MTPTRKKRIAQIKALLARGIIRARDMSRHLDISENYIAEILRDERLRPPGRLAKLFDIAAVCGNNYEVIAERLGINPSTVHRDLIKLGLTPVGKRVAERGFVVPLSRKPEYRALRRDGLTIDEAGEVMGLKARNVPGDRKLGYAGGNAPGIYGTTGQSPGANIRHAQAVSPDF